MNRSPISRRVRIEAHPEGRRQRLGGEARRDRVHQLGPLDPGAQQVDPVRARRHDPVARREPELRQARARRPAVIGQVVERHQDRRPADDRVVGVAGVAKDRRGSGVPVVEVDDVHRAIVGPERLERGPAEQPESPGVVGVIARGIAVEPVAIERRRVVDEAQPVAVRPGRR